MKSFFTLILGVLLLLSAGWADAQTLFPTQGAELGGGSYVNVVGGGWAQLFNLNELQRFAIDVALTLALAALITSHPIRRAARTSPSDYVMPRLFMLYALVGMVVGFLVIQHGYIIGFVVFGIGALLRFRSNLDDPVDTVEMIVVTVLGLCVGMGLPVMALMTGAVCWLAIWVTGQKLPLELRLQADGADSLDAGLGKLRDIATQNRWKLAHLHRAQGKNSARVVLLVNARQGLEGTEDALAEGLADDPLSWKIGR